ncbi:alpha-L-fucosidase [Hyphomonas sp.]|uniref:alpha-L-fucosidase n=1 Tax=Hyphomonas sp. TaxID=87 RepID=UPI0025BDE5EB|nr:alpha-L-fucosidase [Hyphomonas sp.]MBI1400559.1 alpha-L-fucosidase [Hyphomonas sp.]
MTDRPCPEWYARPQLGIFIHWGIFTIPAWAPRGRAIHELVGDDFDMSAVLTPYSEWYENAMRVEGSATRERHKRLYGDKPFTDFRPEFDRAAEAFDANVWADFFVEAGATYVVFVTKHHDGYCLWPTGVPNPHRPGWNTSRDFVGELADAVRARGLRFGVYYSGGLDWTFRNTPIANIGDMFACVPTEEDYRTYALAQAKELIDRYKPSVFWNDICWPDVEGVIALHDYYYAAMPDGVTNDRWLAATDFFNSLRDPDSRASFNAMLKARTAGGQQEETPAPFGDFRCVEFGLGAIPKEQKWESCRGLGLGFGYNSDELPEDYMDADQLITLYKDITSKRGNLLINIGPMADASIPEVQAAPLRALGKELRQ